MKSIKGILSSLVVLTLPQSGWPAVAGCVSPDRSEVRISGGTFLMGSQEHEEEGPVRRVAVKTFSIDRFDVTNANFAKFVAATGYVTDAERGPEPRDYPAIARDHLKAGGAVFGAPRDRGVLQSDKGWWRFVEGANWRHPNGPQSHIVGRENDPVVQVSYNDALAYARWVGRDLPTEEQYEYAARGGLIGKAYAWGDELKPAGKWMANAWQGRFPNQDRGDDGYRGLSPAGCFPPNGYGLYDMVGNVWKWTSSVFSPKQSAAAAATSPVERTIKGGSFLCSTDYCRRFRPAARQPLESNFSSMHVGFRTVKNY